MTLHRNEVLKKCCNSPSIMYGHKGGALEGFILCAHCKNEVFGYVLYEMIALWNNNLILDRLAVNAFVKTVDDKDEELPCMEIVSR